MHRIATSASLGAVVAASCLVAGGTVAAAEPAVRGAKARAEVS
jgi:hypothetical protein